MQEQRLNSIDHFFSQIKLGQNQNSFILYIPIILHNEKKCRIICKHIFTPIHKRKQMSFLLIFTIFFQNILFQQVTCHFLLLCTDNIQKLIFYLIFYLHIPCLSDHIASCRRQPLSGQQCGPQHKAKTREFSRRTLGSLLLPPQQN